MAVRRKRAPARTRRAAIGRSPGCRCRSTGACFPHTRPCFPPALVAALAARCALPGILGDCHASGTEIIRDLGEEHVRTGKPICYTSADSVFQIAAHETHFGLDRLYAVCAVAKELTEPLNIGRVIARPFVGESADTFRRTTNRKDLTTPPHADTLLDRVTAAGGTVVSIGKIADIFAHRGISRAVVREGQHGGVRRDARGSAARRRRHARLRQLRRLRHALRPPPRRARLCGRAGSVRCPPAGIARRAAPGRPRADHRRPWLRPDLERHRPHARAGADAVVRPGHRAARPRPARRPSPTWARRSPATSGSRSAHGEDCLA